MSTEARRMYLYGEWVRNFISLCDKKSSDMISGVQKSGTEILAKKLAKCESYKKLMELAPLLGWIATILFTVCYIPQIIKTAKTKTVEGLSFLLLFIQFIANIIALWYATLINQSPLVVKYILGLLFLAICITLYIKVKLNHSKLQNHEKTN